MTEITSSNTSRARRPLRVHTREIEGGGGQSEKSPERLGLERSPSFPFINRNNFSKNHQNAKALDTAPSLTQTKFSIFENNSANQINFYKNHQNHKALERVVSQIFTQPDQKNGFFLLSLLAFLLLPSVAHADPVTLFAIVGTAIAEMTLTTAITVASISLTIGTTVFGAVAQRAAAKKAKRRAAQAREDFLNSLQERTVTRIATDAPHRYVYGRTMVGADIVAILSSGPNEEFKHIVSVHAAHESDGIEKIYINGKDLGELDADGFVTSGEYYSTKTESVTETFSAAPFTLSHTPSSAIRVVAYGTWISGAFRYPSSGEVPYTRSGNTITVTAGPTSPFPFGGTMQITHYSVSYQYTVNTSQVRVRKHLGVPGDTADASLLAECPDKWKSTATLTGFTYTVIRLDLRQPEFQGGVPDIKVLMRGKKLYDPRTGETKWSQNPALVIYDYLTSEMCGVNPADIPLSNIITAANVCDEQVPGLC